MSDKGGEGTVAAKIVAVSEYSDHPWTLNALYLTCSEVPLVIIALVAITGDNNA